MMKRLSLVVIAAGGFLLSANTMAASQVTTTQNVTINFGKFVYVWANFSALTFDLTKDSATSSSVLSNLSGVYEPSSAGLFECLTGNASSPSSFTPSGTYNGDVTGSNKTCYFAPEFTAPSWSASYWDPDTSAYDNDSDFDILIFSTGAGWTVDAKIDSSPALPNGLSLIVYPFAYDSDETSLVKITQSGTDYEDTPVDLASGKTLSDSDERISNGAFDPDNSAGETYGYYVNSAYWFYLQPIEVTLKLDTSLYDGGSIDGTQTITYTISAP